jgi:branched-chain amino acid transport system substrate-binding protein
VLSLQGAQAKQSPSKDDHQLLYPYYEGVFSKNVKYDAEKTGLGWKTEFKTTVADETLPTTCKMKRPSS